MSSTSSSSLQNSDSVISSSSIPSHSLLTVFNIKNLVPIELTYSNYLVWKSLFIPVLTSLNLLGHIDGTMVCPPSTCIDSSGVSRPNPEYVSWLQRDMAVLSWLNATLSFDILETILSSSSKTARDAWLAIEKLFLDHTSCKHLELSMAAIAVYSSAVQGQREPMKEFYEKEPTSPIARSGETLIHVAALYGHTEVVKELLGLSLPEEKGLSVANLKGNIALHDVARLGMLEMAEEMVKREEGLVCIPNKLGETPLFWAAMYGNKKMLFYLNSVNHSPTALTRNDGATILHVAVLGEFYDLALEIAALHRDLTYARDQNGNTPLHLLANTPSSFESGTVFSTPSLTAIEHLKDIVYLCT